jgi:uncharacterized FlaG/YvyC family protein
MITLSVDCMGGDHGPRVTLAACRRFLDTHADAQLLLVGLPEALSAFAHPRARVVAATEVVAMDDPIEVALRRKKNSSMRVAIEQINNVLKDGGRGLSFVLDPAVDQPIVKVMREDTGEVIRQYPNEAVVRVAHSIEKLKGVLFEGLI